MHWLICKNAFAYTVEPKIWDFSIQVLKDDWHTKCMWKSNSNSSNSNFGRGICMMALSAKEKRKMSRFIIRYSIVHCYQNMLNMANSAGPDETPRLAWVYTTCKCPLFGCFFYKCINQVPTTAYIEF